MAQATNSICILSGTATSYVVDDEFKDSITECLKRGVNIYIGYGYKSSYNNTEKKDFEAKAEDVLKNLKNISSRDDVEGKIYVAEYRNHSKILICDDDYAVCGSFNWLSNAKGQKY